MPAALLLLLALLAPARAHNVVEPVECESREPGLRLSVHWPPQRCGPALGLCTRVLDGAVGAPTQPRCAPIAGYPALTVCCVGEGTQTLEEALVVAQQLNLTNNGKVVFPGRRLIDWLIASATNAFFPTTSTNPPEPTSAQTTTTQKPGGKKLVLVNGNLRFVKPWKILPFFPGGVGGVKLGVYPALPEGRLLSNEPRILPIIYGDILASQTQYKASTSVVVVQDGLMGHCDFLVDTGRPMDRNTIIGGLAAHGLAPSDLDSVLVTRRSPETMGNLNLFLDADLRFGPHSLRRDTVQPGPLNVSLAFHTLANVPHLPSSFPTSDLGG